MAQQQRSVWLLAARDRNGPIGLRKRAWKRVGSGKKAEGPEDRLRGLSAVLACGVIVLGADGTLLDANEAAEHILGIRVADMRGQELARTLATAIREDGSDLPAPERPSQAALQTGRPQRDKVMGITRHDGQQRWLQVDAVPVLDDTGAVVQVVTSFVDITARKNAEKALRDSEARKGAILEAALDAIITVTHEGRIGEFNPAAEGMFGYCRAEALGRNVAELIVPPGEREAHLRGLQRYLATGQARAVGRRVEGWAVRQDGTRFPVEVTTTRIPGADPPVFVGYIRDITARKHAEEALQSQAEALRYQALHDDLTRLPNRALFHDRLEQALLATSRNEQALAVLLLDLDRFKEVNDTLGHDVGDQLLRQVGARMQSVLRASDTVARLGGDEFAILLPGASAEGAAQAAQMTLTALAEPFALSREPDGADHHLSIGASIGIALAPAHEQDRAALLRYADVAMYSAKRGGGGYVVYSSEQDEYSPQRLALTSALRQAIVHDELCLHYQPAVDVQNGQVSWVEALVRWQHPTFGLLMPDSFIPVAEQTGLINPLTRWVLETALRDSRSWAQAGLHVGVAVNLSARNLVDPDLPETIAALLETYDTPASHLRVELTESAIMADPAQATEVLLRIAALGVRIAVDDFGTGYSSLSYLKRLPVAEIKIDKSFVLGMARDGDDATIVASTIGLGHSLGLAFIAEGVEDAATWDVLSALGCDAAQGYYMSRPLAPDALLQWLRERAES